MEDPACFGLEEHVFGLTDLARCLGRVSDFEGFVGICERTRVVGARYEFALMETLGAPTGSGGVKKDSNEEVELEVDGGTPNAFSASLKQIESSEKFLMSSNPIINPF